MTAGCFRLVLGALALLLPVLAPAAAQRTRLSGAEITALFTNATVTGNYINGGFFSEYHAEDGRALGDNGLTLNIDACWNVDEDRVCYHYGKQPDRRTYCFFVEPTRNDTYDLRVAETGRINATASVRKGNPDAHSDGGRRWSCDDLLSSRQRVILPASIRR